MIPRHHKYLRRAIELARAAQSQGDGAYGAILVADDGQVLMEARNTVRTEEDCTAHAELNLVRQANGNYSAKTLAASTLYASCEPCAMCAGAIFWSDIGRVVYGLSYERLYQLRGLSGDMLRLGCREVLEQGNRIIEVQGPCLEDEAATVFT